MEEHEKNRGFMGTIKAMLGSVSQFISASIFPPLVEGAEMVLKTIDDRILLIEKRMQRKISTFLIIGFGGAFLIFSLLFYLKDYLGWGSAAAFFSIGIVVFVIGLLLKIGESTR